MFDFGFSEVLLTSVIALVVLGPEKLPRAASQVGRWVGRARAMARQFREQLEEEVNFENVKKAHKEEEARREAEAKSTGGTAGTTPAGGQSQGAGQDSASGQGATTGQDAASGQGASAVGIGHLESPYTQSAATPNAPFGSQTSPDPAELRADTFSHAHPTDEFGANPLTVNGAAETAPINASAAYAPIESHASASGTVSPPQDSGGAEPQRPEGGEAYASATAPVRAPASKDPATAYSPTPPEKSGSA